MRSRALITVGALALLAGCSDDGETTTAAGLDVSAATTEGGDTDTADTTESTPTTEAPGDEPATTVPSGPEAEAVAQACVVFGETMLLPVGTEYEPSPAGDAAFLDALTVLADTGPAEVRADAAAFAALTETDTLTDEEVMEMSPEELDAIMATMQEGYQAAERVYDWMLGACEVDGIVWACPTASSRGTFTPVGDSIDGEDEPVPSTTEPGASTPEELYGEAESEGEPVEVSRSDEKVVVAWLDEDGHAVEALIVVEDDGWRSGGTMVCDDPTDPGADDGFEPIGEEIPG